MGKEPKTKSAEFDENKMVKSKFGRVLLIIAGTISLALGIIGIILPILPTTPFLLLAAACYARSSERFYNWLINNRTFGKIIKNYYEGKGIPLHVKVYAISLLWITIMISAIFFVPWLIIKILLIIIAFLVSIHILRLPTLKKEDKS